MPTKFEMIKSPFSRARWNLSYPLILMVNVHSDRCGHIERTTRVIIKMFINWHILWKVEKLKFLCPSNKEKKCQENNFSIMSTKTSGNLMLSNYIIQPWNRRNKMECYFLNRYKIICMIYLVVFFCSFHFYFPSSHV